MPGRKIISRLRIWPYGEKAAVMSSRAAAPPPSIIAGIHGTSELIRLTFMVFLLRGLASGRTLLLIPEADQGKHCAHWQYYKRLPNCSVGQWRASVSRGEPLEPMPQRVELCEDLYPLRQPFQSGGGPRAEEEHKEHRGADGLRGSRAKRQAAQKIAKAAQPGNQGEIEC